MGRDATDGHDDLAEALAPLEDAAAPAELAQAVADMFTGRDLHDARHRLHELEEGLRNLLEAAGAVRGRLDALADEPAPEPFGDDWWERRRQAARGPRGPVDWTRAYVHALRAGRHDVAARLASPREELVPGALAAAALTTARALAEDRPADAAGSLPVLLELTRRLPLDAGDRADLVILLARLLLETGDTAAAHERVETALAETGPAADPRLRSRLTAVLGECALTAGDVGAARAAFEQAVGLAEEEPAAPAGLARIAELEGAWPDAESWYDRAVAAAPELAALERLRAPTTGNLYWRLARHLAGHPGAEDEALQALDRALARGMTGPRPHPERRAHVDRGYLLERLGRPREAALAFAEGARRYTWTGQLETARALLERAVDLDGAEAGHRWLLADVLRQLAQRPGDSADPALLGTAMRHWREGLSRRTPARDEAWVHLSRALATYDDVRGVPSERRRLWEAAAATERALLLDALLADGWQLLSSLYGDLGCANAALDAADRAVALDPSEEAAAYYRSRALLGLGRVQEADEALPDAEDWWLRAQRAVLHMVLGQAQEALSSMTARGEPQPLEQLIRALCLVNAGRDEEAVAELAHLPRTAVPATRAGRHEAAWVAHLRGEYDVAEELLRRALEDDPAEPADELIDLGQVLLARGAEGDLPAGERFLDRGVRACRRWDTLRLLSVAELPFLLRRAAGHPHADAVAVVVGRIRPEIDRRMDAIRAETTDLRTELTGVLAAEPGDRTAAAVAASAALARAELEDDPEGALERWLELARHVPEAWEGVVAAAARIRDRTDGGLAGDPPAPGWGPDHAGLLEALGSVPPEATAGADAQDLRRGLAVRVALTALLGQRPQDAGDVLAGEALPPGGPDPVLTAAVGAVVRSGGAYWRLADQVADLSSGDGGGAGLRPWAEAMLAATSLDAVHRTRRDDVDMTTIYPLESPVVVSLGPGLVAEDPGPEWVLLRRLVPGMRERIRERTGVTIPGIRFRGDGTEPDGYRICWDRTPIRGGTTRALPRSDDDEAGLAEVVAELEDVLAGNLDRLLGPDDVELWVQEADPSGEVAGRPRVARLLADGESRLWTHRVLRLLLREGFPLVRGGQVLRALGDALAEGSTDPLDAAHRVRAALPGRVPGLDRALHPLPGPLAERVAAGLRDHGAGSVWQEPWPEAAATVRAVRHWLDGLAPDGSGRRPTVVVPDPRVRHYLWRLLAPGGRPPPVVTAAEASRPRPRSDSVGGDADG